ncbi:MAG: phage tail tape measure protein [Chthonomonas sp.]|nr:phage tail tape measure protein [Chthonomonas sp.]
MATRVAELEVLLEADTKSLEQGMDRANKAIDGVSKRANKGGRSLQEFGNSTSAAGRDLMAFSAPMLGALGYIGKVAADFEKVQNEIQAVAGLTASQMEAVSEKARQLGADLTLPATSSTDAMQAMLELSKAGLSVVDTMEASRGVLLLSAAGAISNARAAEVAANALNAFQLSGDKAAMVADALSAAANRSSAGVDDLAQGFQAGAAVANMYGLTVHEFTTTLAAMANAGIKGSDAGTSVKAMLMALTPKTSKAAEAMAELGLQFYDAAGKLKPFPDILSNLHSVLEPMTQERRNSVMSMIFGSDGVRAASILFQLGPKGFADLAGGISQAGAAGDMASGKLKGFAGAWERLKSVTQSVAEDLGSRVLGLATQVVEGVSQMIAVVSSLPEPVQNGILVFMGLVAAAGPVLMAIGSMATGLSALAPILAALTGPIGLVVAGVAALAAAFATNFGGIRDAVMPLIHEAAPQFLAAWENVKEWMVTAWSGFSAEVASWFEPVVAWFKENLPDIQRTVETVLTTIQEFWKAHGEDITATAKFVWDLIKSIVGTVMQAIGNIIKVVMKVIQGDWKGAWEVIRRYFADLWTGILGVLQKAVVAISGLMVTLWNMIKDAAGRIFHAAVDIGKNIVEGIKQGFMRVWEGAKKWMRDQITAFVEGVRGVLGIRSPSKVFEEIGGYVVQGFVNGIEAGLARMFEVGRAMSLAARAGLDSVPLTGLDALEKAVERAEDRVVQMKTAIAEAMDPVRNGLAKFVGLSLSEWKKLGDGMQKKLVGLRFMQALKEGKLTWLGGLGPYSGPLPKVPEPETPALVDTTRTLDQWQLLNQQIHDDSMKMREDLYDTFTKLFDDILGGGFKNLFGTIQRTISNFLLQQAHAGLSERFGSWLGGALNIPGFGGGMSPVPVGPMGGIFAAAMSIPGLLKRRSVGGPVSAGDTALVGEEGPEVVQFGRSGSVTSARQTAALAGSNNIVVHIHINAMDAGSVVRSSKQVAQQFGNAIRDAMGNN